MPLMTSNCYAPSIRRWIAFLAEPCVTPFMVPMFSSVLPGRQGWISCSSVWGNASPQPCVSQLARQQACQYGGRISFGSTSVSGFDSRLTVTQDDFVNSKDHKSDYKEHKVEDNLTSYFTMCSFWMTGHWTILCNPMCYCQGSFYWASWTFPILHVPMLFPNVKRKRRKMQFWNPAMALRVPKRKKTRQR